MNFHFRIYAEIKLMDGSFAGRLQDERFESYEAARAAMQEVSRSGVRKSALPVVEFGGSELHDEEANSLVSLLYTVVVLRGNLLISSSRAPTFKTAFTRLEALRRVLPAKSLTFKIMASVMGPGGVRERPKALDTMTVWLHEGKDDKVIYGMFDSSSVLQPLKEDDDEDGTAMVPRPLIAKAGRFGRALRVRQVAAHIKPIKNRKAQP